jgi:gamma-glutamyltranspeptidase/glutathione hydrolase
MEESEAGMVVSASRHASEAGAEILRKGGNAVDAAVATGLALAVTFPRAGNIGGGGFMLVRLADGRTVFIDYRETAPAAAIRKMYLDESGNVIPRASTVGHRAAAVPGTLAGLAHALEKYGSGRITWADAVEPARRLAADGFPLSLALAREFVSHRSVLERFPESARIFLRDGKPWKRGELFRQPELAATLGRIQRDGAREFYEGETARLLVAEMENNGGLITAADLKNYKPVEREPLRGAYRGHEIITAPPPSSGGIVILQTLGMIEPVDIASTGPNSAATIHLMAEAMRRAFCDRSELMGDPLI